MAAPHRSPRLDALAAALSRHPPAAEPRSEGMMEAAVTAVLRQAHQLELLLIRRVERSEDPWSGQMALPGGRRERGDPDLVRTAFRETEEEVGIALDPEVHLLGGLDEVRPSSRHLPPLVIAPWVAAVDPAIEVVPDPREVALALWVPVDELRREVSEVHYERDGFAARFPAYRVQGHDVWGLTHRILERLFDLLDRAEPR